MMGFDSGWESECQLACFLSHPRHRNRKLSPVSRQQNEIIRMCKERVGARNVRVAGPTDPATAVETRDPASTTPDDSRTCNRSRGTRLRRLGFHSRQSGQHLRCQPLHRAPPFSLVVPVLGSHQKGPEATAHFPNFF